MHGQPGVRWGCQKPEGWSASGDPGRKHLGSLGDRNYCHHSSHSASASSDSYPLSGPTDDALALSSASCDVKRPTGLVSGSARKPEEPLAARGRVLMKKANDRQSPPKLLGGCAPPRGALVAMDATAAACGRDRGGLPS